MTRTPPCRHCRPYRPALRGLDVCGDCADHAADCDATDAAMPGPSFAAAPLRPWGCGAITAGDAA